VRLARGIQNEIGACMPNYKSPFMPSPWQFTGGSPTKSMLKKESKGLITDIAALTTLSTDLQSASAAWCVHDTLVHHATDFCVYFS